jgi:hypothetical protein
VRTNRLAASALCAITFAVGCAKEPPEPAHEPQQYSIEEFLDVTNYRGLSFSPDKTHILVSSDASGIYNAYAVSVSQGGEPQQLSTSRSSTARSAISLRARVSRPSSSTSPMMRAPSSS